MLPRTLPLTTPAQPTPLPHPQQQRGGGAPLREEREQDPHVRAAALEGGAKWGHDAFSGPRGGGAGGGARRGPRGPRDPTTLGTKL